jgi:hypothetical protein
MSILGAVSQLPTFFLIIPAAIYPSSVQKMSKEIVNFARDKTKVRYKSCLSFFAKGEEKNVFSN